MKYVIAIAFALSLASCGHTGDAYWAGVSVGVKQVQEN